MGKSSHPPILLLIVFICFPQLSETIYTPSLPNLAEDLHVSAGLSQWTLSIYFIGFSLGVGFWGAYSDSAGRRPAILMGTLVYILGSIGCYFSHSISLLLTMRLMQAFGISVGSVVVQSILRESFEPKRRNQLFSQIVVATAFSPLLGPLVGGALSGRFGWKMNFLFLIGSGVLLFFTSLKYLTETHHQRGKSERTLGFGSLFSRLMSSPKIVTYLLLVALFNGIMFSFFSEAPFIFIDLIGLSPSSYGLLGLLIGIGVLMGGCLTNYLNRRWRAESIIRLGCMGLIISIIILNITTGLVSVKHGKMINISYLLLPITLFFFFFNISIPILLSTALQGFEKNIGTASSIFGAAYYILTAIFNFIMGYLDNHSITRMPRYFLALSGLMLILTLLSYLRDRKNTPKTKDKRV